MQIDRQNCSKINSFFYLVGGQRRGGPGDRAGGRGGALPQGSGSDAQQSQPRQDCQESGRVARPGSHDAGMRCFPYPFLLTIFVIVNSYRVRLSFITVFDCHLVYCERQCCGSPGSGAFLTPWIRDPGWVKSQDPDPG
jgi:hypothetical protein